MKKIKLKIDFEVEDKYKFIAQDRDGELLAFVEKPVINDKLHLFESVNQEIHLASGSPNENWRESLREI